MTEADTPDSGLDARLRRTFAGVDTDPGFEARVAARVAALRVESAEILRARAESGRLREARRVRREAWLNAVTAAGAGTAAIAVVWRHGPAVARWTESVFANASDPAVLMGIALSALAFGLWPALRGWLPR